MAASEIAKQRQAVEAALNVLRYKKSPRGSELALILEGLEGATGTMRAVEDAQRRRGAV